MIIIVNKYLLSKGFRGITLWPFVILKYDWLKQDKLLLNHERIHLRQQLELLILPFYVWYATEYLVRLSIYRNKMLAYKNISFEREAYKNENQKDYLDRRPLWAFLKFL